MNIIKGKISKEDLLAERADHQLILHEAKVELEKTTARIEKRLSELDEQIEILVNKEKEYKGNVIDERLLQRLNQLSFSGKVSNGDNRYGYIPTYMELLKRIYLFYDGHGLRVEDLLKVLTNCIPLFEDKDNAI